MLCFGCGSDISSNPADRRRLVGKVSDMWKALTLEQNADRSEDEIEKMLNGDGSPEKSGRMCRKCFSCYERLIKLTHTLKANQNKFLQSLGDDLRPPAKRRPSTTTKFPSCIPSTTSDNRSPPVAVCNNTHCTWIVVINYHTISSHSEPRQLPAL